MNIKPVKNYGKSIASAVNELCIAKAEADMLKLPQAECSVSHMFGPGVYIRQVTLPADTYAIGHHQNFEHQNIVLSGRVTMVNSDGTTTEICAPAVFVGKPGRKIGYVHEDTVWLNVYPTEEKDIETLESKYIKKSIGWQEDRASKDLLMLKNSIDADDYKKVLAEYGFTEKVARKQSENTDDMCDLPFGAYKCMVSDSQIEGRGLFATSPIKLGEVICPARIGSLRTIGGRFTNHSAKPNAKMAFNSIGNIDLVAIKDISGCHGGQNGEEITIDYRGALSLQVKKVEA